MGRPRKTDDGIIKFEARCKVCNSQFKNIIEDLYDNNLNARQIFEALSSLQDEKSKQILIAEQLSESAIARHLNKHYSSKANTALKQASTTEKLLKSRESFRDGIQTKINTISTLSHLIEIALINLESLDNFPDGRQRHQLTINYMGQIKGLIDEFSKLTGELQTENTFDIHFWNVQITEFANIVIQTIRKMDHQFNLNNQLEYSFGMEFKKMWDQYRETQKKILDGELPVNYGEKERNINTFNVMPEYNDADNKENDNEVEYFNSLNNNINDDDKEEETKELYSQLDNSYHTHYLLEDEDYHEFDELNTINDDEENKYNNKHIINHLQQLPIQEEEKISKNEQYLNENKDDIINNQEKQNLYNLQQVNIPVNNIKKMKNAAKALKDKYLRK